MNFDIECPKKCKRCKKPIFDGEGQGFIRFPKGPIEFVDGSPTIAVTFAYHNKCIPPVMFHSLAAANLQEMDGPCESSTRTNPAGEI